MTWQLLARTDVEQVVATCRQPEASAGLREAQSRHPRRLVVLPLDVLEEDSIAGAAEQVLGLCDRLHLLVNCAGVLHAASELQPEKRLEALDPAALRQVFEVNAFGPIIVARHFLPLLRHEERSVVANLSARVGSIEDNQAGGWYGYRASKAAQNMFTKTLAIELRRRAPSCICVALHPGTVDTDLSRPFQHGVDADRLFSVERAAHQLLEIIDSLQPDETGSFLGWDRKPIPW